MKKPILSTYYAEAMADPMRDMQLLPFAFSSFAVGITTAPGQSSFLTLFS